MNGDHPTSGDYAWAAASQNDSETKALRKRVKTLELELEAIKDWSTEVAATINAALDVLSIEEEVRQRLMP